MPASRSSIIGALGVGKQSAKGSAASTFHYIPATSINLNAQQQVQQLPPEIGGQYFLRGSYKAGVAAGGDVGLVVRGDSIGHLLYMLNGGDVAVADGGTPAIANPSVAPTLTAVAGSTNLLYGTYLVAYSYVNAAGETQVSATTSVSITAGQGIQVTALATPPVGTTAVNYYLSLGPGSSVLGFSATNAAGGQITLTTAGNGVRPPASNNTGTPDGTLTHTFVPFAPSAGASLPWHTLVKDVGKLYAEQFVDTHMASLRLDISKQAIVTATASFFGLTPSEIAVPGTEIPDTSACFTAVNAGVGLTDESGTLTFGADISKPERISLDFANQLSQDEFVVGSPYPYDSTLLQRSASVSYDTVVRSPDLVRAVYRNGGTTAWDPAIVRGHLNIALVSTTKIGATTRPYALTIDLPGIDFLMMPVAMQGAQLIRANLSAQVTLGSSGADTFTFTVVSDIADYTA